MIAGEVTVSRVCRIIAAVAIVVTDGEVGRGGGGARADTAARGRCIDMQSRPGRVRVALRRRGMDRRSCGVPDARIMGNISAAVIVFGLLNHLSNVHGGAPLNSRPTR